MEDTTIGVDLAQTVFQAVDSRRATQGVARDIERIRRWTSGRDRRSPAARLVQVQGSERRTDARR
jgi:hypothetical protein